MSLPIGVVDAFAERAFRGNPAAVCLLAEPREAAWMQQLAAEMNLSETAFLHPENGGFHLRWFTPTVEVDLCGHATLGSAHFLWEQGRLAADQPARFHTRSGTLVAERRGDVIEMDFPAKEEESASPPEGLLKALGIEASYVGRNRLDYLVLVESQPVLESVQPDFAALAKVPCRGIIVTSGSADPRYDFVSRFFAPASGVNEDPVTGSAHCCLAPFWAKRLGKREMQGYQASRRGGVVRVRVNGDRVALGGKAVTIWRGELLAG